MEKYDIQFRPSAYKELNKLPQKDIQAILTKIDELSENPRPIGIKKLSGRDSYRIRIGHYRIIYSINDNILIILVIKIGHRKSVYK